MTDFAAYKNNMSNDEFAEMLEKKFKDIFGGTIRSVVFDDDGFVALIIDCVDGKERNVFFDRDEEGNGPGMAYIHMDEDANTMVPVPDEWMKDKNNG